MVELIVIACLVAEPARCEEFHVPFHDQVHMVQCVWQSQIFAARWSQEHPGWIIKKVTCGLPRA
jgi:hypothetical protein